jgi:hypothetical protein
MTQDWQDRLRETQQLLQRLGSNPDGKALIKLLRETFEDRHLRGDDPYDTYYRLGQRDVVQYLRTLMEGNKDV